MCGMHLLRGKRCQQVLYMAMVSHRAFTSPSLIPGLHYLALLHPWEEEEVQVIVRLHWGSFPIILQ